jgi:hypothetical protein
MEKSSDDLSSKVFQEYAMTTSNHSTSSSATTTTLQVPNDGNAMAMTVKYFSENMNPSIQLSSSAPPQVLKEPKVGLHHVCVRNACWKLQSTNMDEIRCC